MAHNAACGASRTPPWECDCSCRGTLHGRTLDGVAVAAPDYSIPPQEPLLTREWFGQQDEAFLRAYRTLAPSARAAHQYALGHYAGWRARLPWPVERALVDYRGDGYRPVNAANRGLRRMTRRYRRQTEAIERAIFSAPPTERRLTVYRNVGSPAELALWESDAMPLGHSFPKRAFCSTTFNPAVSKHYGESSGGGMISRIVLPRDTQAAYLDVVHDMGEREMLLGRGLWFRYEGRTSIGGLHLARLRIIQEPG